MMTIFLLGLTALVGITVVSSALPRPIPPPMV